MNFTEIGVQGAYQVDLELLEDERGFFARTWCQREFSAHGLETNLVQCNLSYNRRKGTLRGMHLQLSPFAEAKLVRCTRGALYDVILDLRRASRTYLNWTAVELTAENRKALYIPKGCAHGFLSLADDTEIFYQMSEFYVPATSSGVRWDDPTFKIHWPAPVQVISPRDAAYPDFDPGSDLFNPASITTVAA